MLNVSTTTGQGVAWLEHVKNDEHVIWHKTVFSESGADGSSYGLTNVCLVYQNTWNNMSNHQQTLLELG